MTNSPIHRFLICFTLFPMITDKHGLMEDDYLGGFLIFQLRIERISMDNSHLYCSICDCDGMFQLF